MIKKNTEDLHRNQLIRASWLYYIGGKNQVEIAKDMDISRFKVGRLLAESVRSGIVEIRINATESTLVSLEEQLKESFSLKYAVVAPVLDHQAPEAGHFINVVDAVVHSGANWLGNLLNRPESMTLAVGWGQTLYKMAQLFNGLSLPQHKFVSLIGSLTRKSSFNSLDIIHLLSELTRAEGYIIPAPFLADSYQDKQVLINQRTVNDSFTLIDTADLAIVSIGELTDTSTLAKAGLIRKEEIHDLQAQGAVADLLGFFINEDGEILDCEINRCVTSYDMGKLANLDTVCIAAGKEKWQALKAAMNTGLINGLIVDEWTAEWLLGNRQE